MPKTKTKAETKDKAPPPPDVQRQPQTPDKEGGPLPATEPADRLGAGEQSDGAPGRARAMADMQGTVGNARISRMLGTDVQTKHQVGDAGDRYEQEADHTADAVMRAPQQAPEADETPSEQPQAGIAARMISRLPAPRIQRARARGLVSQEVREIRRKLRWFRHQLDRLETDRTITSEEAEGFRSQIDAFLREAETLSERRETSRKEARRIWRRGRQLLRVARGVRRSRRSLRRRAARGRSTRGLRLISNFRIRPPVIRVQKGEAARISFVLQRPARSIAWFILSHEGGGDVGTSIREFRVKNKEPGYKVAIWNGTWERERNQPPDPGTYRVHLWVTDREGNSEEVFDQIRIENPDREVVHPRTGSGYALKSLRFDGSHAVLSDEKGNTLRMRAVSGLKRRHHLNPGRVDYTQARHQWVKNRGPIPEGTYTIRANSVQRPEIQHRSLRYSTGGSARAWGPYRVPLYPSRRRNRSEFFVHLDVTDDGTAGCIGIHPSDEGKFNSLMSLLATMPNDLKVIVSYSGGGHE